MMLEKIKIVKKKPAGSTTSDLADYFFRQGFANLKQMSPAASGLTDGSPLDNKGHSDKEQEIKGVDHIDHRLT